MKREIQSYTDLVAWQTARRLVRQVYVITGGFPALERFGLAQQLRRAAVSIPSNIAEGFGRSSLRDYIRFLQVARGSLFEVQTQLTLAQDLGYLAADDVEPVVEATNECARVLHGLLRSLKPTTEAAAAKEPIA